MDFRIADTFTDSLARLTGDEQKARARDRLLVTAVEPGSEFLADLRT
ncbi:MAG: hypothetical protein MUC36_21390 [Planctomycetes bacterium]|jgi:hypothetical protein|nr:hypothetical protein [Planctomycetota bacterium]